MFFIFFGIIILLIRGYFVISANSVIILMCSTVWLVMFLDHSALVSRMDTIAFILAILILTPLAFIQRGHAILLYGLLNLIALWIFTIHTSNDSEIPHNSVMDYIADNSIAIIFITITAFAIFTINRRALDRAEKELAERTIADEHLKRSLEEKEVLIRELHHRVRNNMQVVSSLLSLQSRKFDDPKFQSYFKESQMRITSMALVHEKLYNTQDMSMIDFPKYLQGLTSHLLNLFNIHNQQIKLDITAENIHLGIDTAVPCGMIVNELVSNSLKHAFLNRGSGEINIHLFKNEHGRYTLVVGDNGIGYQGNFDDLPSDTLGIQLIRSLVKQIDGKIRFDGNNGTTATIDF